MRPQRVAVINLARRGDRLQAFARRWYQATGGADYELVEGVDVPGDPGLGCWLAHLRALRAGPGPVLVLEDDAVFTEAFSLDLDPPPGWWLLRMGGQLRSAAPPAAPPWVPVARIAHTHAYVAREPGRLADWVAAARNTDVGLALSWRLRGHYRLTPATVGQAAGHSDVDGGDRPADQFWD